MNYICKKTFQATDGTAEVQIQPKKAAANIW